MTSGDKRGKWLFLRDADPPKFSRSRKNFGEFRCDCGTVRIVGICDVVNGRSRSCGCAKRHTRRAAIRAHVAEVMARRKEYAK